MRPDVVPAIAPWLIAIGAWGVLLNAWPASGRAALALVRLTLLYVFVGS